MCDIKQNLEAPPKKNSSATIYVWESGYTSLGHVSIKLNGEEKGDPGTYFSIWPKSTPAGGLTSVWPLKGTLARTLDADCWQEAVRPSQEFSNLLEEEEIFPAQPDKVVVIEGLDMQKMKDELTRVEKGLETGEIRYQLLPGVKFADFFNKFRSGSHNSEVYNCVTLTGHFINVGGQKNFITSPWTTPYKFANNLLQFKQNHSSKPEGVPNPMVAGSSFSFFNRHNDKSSFLIRKVGEVDLGYVQRMDAMVGGIFG